MKPITKKFRIESSDHIQVKFVLQYIFKNIKSIRISTNPINKTITSTKYGKDPLWIFRNINTFIIKKHLDTLEGKILV
jgi:hypothetical protein